MPASPQIPPSRPPTARLSWPPAWVGTALIIAITLLAYAPAFRAGFIWDDDLYIEANPILTEPGGLVRIWSSLTATPQFYPLVFTSFWIERRLWGLDPMGYHIVNIALHIGVSLLLWTALRRLRIPLAFLAALIFAVHPVTVESVAWVTERKNTLSTFFYLAALLSYLRFASLDRPTGDLPAAPKPHWPSYFSAIALFSAAILSKTVTCSLPAAIALIVYWKRGRVRARDILPLLPMFAMGLAGAAVTIWVERNHVRSIDFDLGLSPIDRVLVAGRAAWFYLGKVLFPTDLAFIYTRWTIDARIWWQFLFPAAGIAAIAALWALRARIGRGPLVAALFFVGTLVPALGFVDIYPLRYSFVADHFQYLASIGPITLAVAAGAFVLNRFRPRDAAPPRTSRPGLWLIAPAVLIATLSVLTARQTLMYHSRETLWRDTIHKSPDAWMAFNNLGGILCQQGKMQEGMACFARALELNPRHAMALCNLALAHYSLGELVRAQGFIDRALAIDRKKPLILETAARIADARGNASLAADYYLAQADMLANRPGVRLIAGNALLRAGRHAEAVLNLQHALTPQPGAVPVDPAVTADGLVDLADSLLAQGLAAEAAPPLEQALHIRPDHRRGPFLRASLLASGGKTSEAISQLEAAVRAGLNDADAFALLGELNRTPAGNPTQARHWFEEAIRLNPSHRLANMALGRMAAAEGKRAQAAEHFLAVLRSKPGDPEATTALLEIQRR